MAIQISISNAIGSRYRGSVVPPVDPDAQAFITAAAITDPTQQAAINTLVVDLKGYNVWSKMKALYPFVGGTAAQHKWNLKDPRDLDAAFRLVFSGGWTHSANGALPNGTNAYADTKLVPSTALSLDNTNVSIYSRTNSADNMVDIGCENSVSTSRIYIHTKWSDNNFYGDSYIGTTNRVTYSMGSTNSTGLFSINRTSSSILNAWRNSTKLGTNTNASIGLLPNTNLWLGAANGANNYYSSRQIAFASIGDGLSDTEAANLYTAVQAFQTALNRNV